MHEICLEDGGEFVFNVRQCFRNFMLEAMPKLEVTHENNNVSPPPKLHSNQYRNMAEDLAINNKFLAKDISNLPRGLIFAAEKENPS